MPMLTEDEYADVVTETSVYPKAHTGSKLALAYTGLGLAGEAGEVADKVKKILRGDKSLDEARDEIVKELGDVVWYIHALAYELDVSIQEIRDVNATKLLSRKDRGVLKGSGDNR